MGWRFTAYLWITKVEIQMTIINTLRFGELECTDDDFLTFSKALLGFPTEDRFVLLSEGIQAPFMWLQSLKSPELALVVLDPWLVLMDYQLELTVDLKRRLEIVDEEQVMILGIVVIPKDPKAATINLRAPVVINVKKRLGEQIILIDEDYDLRYPIFQK